MSDADETLATVREAVQSVSAEQDYSKYGEDEALNLDSVNRISLIVALENAFQTELNTEEMLPEDYETLGSLKAFILKST